MKQGVCIRSAEEESSESAVACEQAAFGRERICASFPPHLAPAMLAWMARWSRYLLASRFSFVALLEQRVLAFCMCELFPPPLPFADPEPCPPSVSAPIQEILNTLEAELTGLVTGNLAPLNEQFHIRHHEPALAERMREGTAQGKHPVLHVAQIGCLQDPNSAGLVKATLLVALRHAKEKGVKFAFAETSGPQSTALCRGTGARVMLTSFLNRFSSFDFIRGIPECEDRNPDVSHFTPGRVPPVIRLVVWDLETLTL